tara:strand:- start:100 stop:693 length:594 start_codon:yes stop_codon:yes gene_type:complete
MLLLTDKLAAGVDEVGRGCLAGPVVAAAVILPCEFDPDLLIDIDMITDSKKLNARKRDKLYHLIKDIALDYSVAFIDNDTIDKVNIRNATQLAMHKAIDKLNVDPEHLYIDGDFYDARENEMYECVLQGDSKLLCIAAASILAKVERDEYVTRIMSREHPYYGWETNKGYGTVQHYAGIKQHGITSYHRKSFNLLRP